jgi:hypothetical protein
MEEENWDDQGYDGNANCSRIRVFSLIREEEEEEIHRWNADWLQPTRWSSVTSPDGPSLFNLQTNQS